MKISAILINAALCAAAALTAGESAQEKMKRYSYTFDSPGKSAVESMPIGNGDIAANVYTVGDSLFLLMSKNDAYDGSGESIKTGRVKIKLSPNPFAAKDFRQTLDIADACVRIDCSGVKIKVWADANNPVYRVDIKSDAPLDAEISNEFWKRRFFQDAVKNSGDALVWYHTNPNSAFAEYMNLYRVAHQVIDIDKVEDPLLHRTFANMVRSKQARLEGGKLVGRGREFSIYIHTVSAREDNPENILPKLESRAKKSDELSDFEKHKKWWADFWDRSYIAASSNDIPEDMRQKQTSHKKFGERDEPDKAFIVSQHYNAQRYMMACQSRGERQTKFNGGLFTVPMLYNDKFFGEDDRNWGRRHTFQNQRLLYWPMIQAGDYDLMAPFFNHYLRLLPIRKAITKMWFGVDGAYYRENCEIAGEEIGDGGAFNFKKNSEGLIEMGDMKNRPERKHLMPAVAANGSQQARPEEYIDGNLLPNKVGIGEFRWMGYHNVHINSGLEICYMAINYYRHTRDEKFLNNTLLPIAREVIMFFDKHFPRDENGKLNIEPGQAIETYWYVKNNTPDVAGLHAVLDGLLEIGSVPREYAEDWKRLKGELPPVPTAKDGAGRARLAIGEKVMTVPFNSENPELYAAFPYELYGAAKGNADVVRNTMPLRRFKGHRCWNQDEIFFAHAGMAQEAKDFLTLRFSFYGQSGTRLPMYARGYNDYIPDFDNNGSGSVALQRMLIQEDGNKILLLPAWPKEWDCEFKLRANSNTTVSGAVKGGKLTALEVYPASRRADVAVADPQ